MEARLTDKVENEVLEMEEEETQSRVTYVPSVTYRVGSINKLIYKEVIIYFG